MDKFAAHRTSFTYSEKFILGWGKIRRFVYHVCFPGYINNSKKRRRGECARCGACCKLLHKCISLEGADGATLCRIHQRRVRNCRVFPVDERDLKDRNIICPDKPCGFSFIPKNGK